MVRAPGAVSNEPVISVDYFPTVCEAAGVEPPKDRPIDGQSLVGHLKSDGKQPLDRDALYWHFPHYRHAPGPYSIIRAHDYKLIKYYEGPRYELYNLKDDLSEKKNLAKEKPGKVQLLDAKLMLHLQAVGAKVPKANPNYKQRGKR